MIRTLLTLAAGIGVGVAVTIASDHDHQKAVKVTHAYRSRNRSRVSIARAAPPSRPGHVRQGKCIVNLARHAVRCAAGQRGGSLWRDAAAR